MWHMHAAVEMDWMKNIVVNLQAKEAAAVLIALIFGITVLGVFGKGVLAGLAIGFIVGIFSQVIGLLVQKNGKNHD